MKDRIPTKPGRVQIAPEDGGAPYYAVVTMADEPTEEGTPPIKENLLDNATAAIINTIMGGTPDTVNEALNLMASKGVRASEMTYVGTGTYGSGNPTVITLPFIPKLIYISESYTSDGNAVTTGDGSFHMFFPYDLLIAGKSTGTPAFYVADHNAFYKCTYSLSSDNLTLSFYSANSASQQLNSTSLTYCVILIGGGE